MSLVPSDELLGAALAVLDEQRRRLRELAVPGELVLVGGCSVRGALTRGDIDLHLRVPPPDFADAVTRLRAALPVVHPQIWTATLATFEVPRRRSAGPPVGLAATPVGSEHDLRFTRSWQLLAADPTLVAEYNAAKLAADGPAGPGYESRKSALFDRLTRLWPDHPAGGRAGQM